MSSVPRFRLPKHPRGRWRIVTIPTTFPRNRERSAREAGRGRERDRRRRNEALFRKCIISNLCALLYAECTARALDLNLKLMKIKAWYSGTHAVHCILRIVCFARDAGPFLESRLCTLFFSLSFFILACFLITLRIYIPLYDGIFSRCVSQTTMNIPSRAAFVNSGLYDIWRFRVFASASHSPLTETLLSAFQLVACRRQC